MHPRKGDVTDLGRRDLSRFFSLFFLLFRGLLVFLFRCFCVRFFFVSVFVCFCSVIVGSVLFVRLHVCASRGWLN